MARARFMFTVCERENQLEENYRRLYTDTSCEDKSAQSVDF